MTTRDVGILVGMGLLGVAGAVGASTGMPWENNLDVVARSLTGKAGAGAATIGLAMTGFNWSRGTEHGKEAFLTTAIGTGLIFGGAKIVSEFGGGAGAASVMMAQALSWSTVVSSIVGDLLGLGAWLTWIWAALVASWKYSRHG